jgi:hypothetical protein
MNEHLEKLIKTVFDVNGLINDINKRDDLDISERNYFLSISEDIKLLGLRLIRVRNKLEEVNENVNNNIYCDEDWKTIGDTDNELKEIGKDLDILMKSFKLEGL